MGVERGHDGQSHWSDYRGGGRFDRISGDVR